MSIQDIKTKLRDVAGIESLTMTMLAGKMQFGIAGKLVQVDAAASDSSVCDAIRAAMSCDAIAQIPAGVPVSPTVPSATEPPLASPALSATAGAAEVTAPALSSNNTAQSEGPAATSIEGNAAPAQSSTAAPITPASTVGTGGVAPIAATPPSPSPSAALIPTVGIALAAPATSKPTGKPMTISTGASAAGHTLKQMIEAQKAKIASTLQDNLAKIQEGFDRQNQAVAAVGSLGDKVHAEADDLMATVGQFANDIG